MSSASSASGWPGCVTSSHVPSGRFPNSKAKRCASPPSATTEPVDVRQVGDAKRPARRERTSRRLASVSRRCGWRRRQMRRALAAARPGSTIHTRGLRTRVMPASATALAPRACGTRARTRPARWPSQCVGTTPSARSACGLGEHLAADVAASRSAGAARVAGALARPAAAPRRRRGRDRARVADGSAEREIDVQADVELGKRAGQPARGGRRPPAREHGRRGHDACGVGLLDRAVDAVGETVVVGVDDQPPHAAVRLEVGRAMSVTLSARAGAARLGCTTLTQVCRNGNRRSISRSALVGSRSMTHDRRYERRRRTPGGTGPGLRGGRPQSTQYKSSNFRLILV